LKTRTRITAFLLAFALAQNAPANLVTDGTFTTVNYTGPANTTPIIQPGSTYFGQIGGTTGAASGSTLTVSGWTTGGYNFVYNAGNADQGTSSNGSQLNNGSGTTYQEAPGQYNVSSGANKGYGNTFLWGTNNTGVSTITAPPLGGNFVAADGAFEVGALTQSISGLTVGYTYALTFYWAAAQQQGFTGTTTENWTVSLGTGNVAGNFTTSTYNLASESFSGWQQATMYFYANSTTETLSFLAAGTPSGEPPFSLVADVDLEIVPDFSNWLLFTGFGTVCMFLEILRRRRRRGLESIPAV
jgi:hypothetical protein